MATQPLKIKIQYQAYRIVLWQLLSVAVLSLFAMPFFGIAKSTAVITGGMVYGLPNLLFVWGVFRFVSAQQMPQFVTAFFIGEMLKLMISALLFVMIVNYLSLSLLFTLLGFIGGIVSFWIVSLLHFSK